MYPPLKAIPEVSVKIAMDVINYNYKNGIANMHPMPQDLETHIRDQLYDTTYSSYLPGVWHWPSEHEIHRNS